MSQTIQIPIVLTIDVPDGVSVTVGVVEGAHPAQVAAAATPPAAGPAGVHDATPGECPKHRRALKAGKYGWYCPSKDDSQTKGYCTLTPGDVWNGLRLVAP